MIYFVIFVILIILALNYDIHEAKLGRGFWYTFILIVLICFAGLRYRVGGDSLNYIDEYDDFPLLPNLINYNFLTSRWDPLWVVFCSICRTINKDFFVLQCLHAIIVNTVIFRFIKRNTRYRFTGILLYYIFAYVYFNMEILRESLAISVFLIALKYFQDRKFKQYYFLAFIAFLFHSSGIILFLFPLIPRFKLNKWTIFLLITVFATLLIFQDRINTLFSLFYFNQRIENKAEVYSNYNLNINGTIINLIRFCIVPIYLMHISKKYLKFNYQYTFLLITMVGMGLIIIFVPIFARFNNYMTIIYVLFLTEFLNRLYRARYFAPIKSFAFSAAFIVITCMQLYPYFEDTSRYALDTHHYNYWYPYHSVFDKEMEQKRERLREGEFH